MQTRPLGGRRGRFVYVSYDPVMPFWPNQRVVVTGGSGFLGHHVVTRLRSMGCGEITAPRRAEYDLRDLSQVTRLYRDLRPTLVIHLAAVVGGIGANRE